MAAETMLKEVGLDPVGRHQEQVRETLIRPTVVQQAQETHISPTVVQQARETHIHPTVQQQARETLIRPAEAQQVQETITDPLHRAIVATVHPEVLHLPKGGGAEDEICICIRYSRARIRYSTLFYLYNGVNDF